MNTRDVPQQASSNVCISLKCQSDLYIAQCGCAVSVVRYQKVVANRLVQGSRAESRGEVCVVAESQYTVRYTYVWFCRNNLSNSAPYYCLASQL